ncbi:MAG TPA: NAD(P)-dependent oxidoreductase [Pseudolabrys sp.]|nr:NAD(P)-dependent oxidoreductase [Pseudolabrys sp.]
MKSIAFVGLGNMGGPMAARLAARGFTLSVYDKRPEAVRAFLELHAGRAADAPADAGRGADAAIMMLPDDDAVREVLLCGGGLVAGLRRGAVVIDMGTSDPRATIEVGMTLAARGIRYVDAPVMGGVAFARDATLDVLVGGSDDDVDRCMPIFVALGRQVIRCGALGSGHTLKALANYVNASTLVTVIEALTIGRKFGLDTTVMAGAMLHLCTGRQHPLEKKVIPHVLTGNSATGTALSLTAKDLAIATDLGRSIGVPLAGRMSELWYKAEHMFGGEANQAQVPRLWEERKTMSL